MLLPLSFCCTSPPSSICAHLVFPPHRHEICEWFVMLLTFKRLVSLIWPKLRRLICLSFLLDPSHIPSLSVFPSMTHLAYIRIYLTPKNKKRIIWTATNKTFSYSDTSGSCFPASGVSLMHAAHLGVTQPVRWQAWSLVFPQKVPVYCFTLTINSFCIRFGLSCFNLQIFSSFCKAFSF